MENKKDIIELIREKNKLREELKEINKNMRKLKKEIEEIADAKSNIILNITKIIIKSLLVI